MHTVLLFGELLIKQLKDDISTCDMYYNTVITGWFS